MVLSILSDDDEYSSLCWEISPKEKHIQRHRKYMSSYANTWRTIKQEGNNEFPFTTLPKRYGVFFKWVLGYKHWLNSAPGLINVDSHRWSLGLAIYTLDSVQGQFFSIFHHRFSWRKWWVHCLLRFQRNSFCFREFVSFKLLLCVGGSGWIKKIYRNKQYKLKLYY